MLVQQAKGCKPVVLYRKAPTLTFALLLGPIQNHSRVFIQNIFAFVAMQFACSVKPTAHVHREARTLTFDLWLGN